MTGQTEYIRPTSGDFNVDDVDPLTLAYLEKVTECTGQAAVNKWLRYVGWRDESDLNLKKKKAKNPDELKRKQNNSVRRPGNRSFWYGATRQISALARMQIAYNLARKTKEMENAGTYPQNQRIGGSD
jgi:hypothetical protein